MSWFKQGYTKCQQAIILLGSFFLALAAGSSNATQLSFKKIEQENSYLFQYQWQDANKQKQSLNVELDKKALLNKFRSFRSYKANMAEQYINSRLKRKVRKHNWQGVKVHFEQVDGTLQVSFEGDDANKLQAAQNTLQELQEKSHQDYLKKHYYTDFSFPNVGNALKPDHARFAEESALDLKPLKPLILEKASIKNIREVTEFTLGFIQTIPYDTLYSRVSSSGAGFNPPLKLLWENQGDCDSKVTLAISLLRSVMPRVKMALIFLEDHALMGIKALPNDDDITITHNNITYVLAEPTGPALLKLGQVSERSEQAIYQGQYTVEEFHEVIVASE